MMPVFKSATGNAYVPPEYLHTDNPRDLLSADIYASRVKEAEYRILMAFRFASQPLYGRGLGHEIGDIGSTLDSLVNYIDSYDGRHARRVHSQRRAVPRSNSQLGHASRLIRSPQNMNRRRWALFRENDIPSDRLKALRLMGKKGQHVYLFVELMRWLIIEDAVISMIKRGDIGLINDRWYVSVRIMDKHRKTIKGVAPVAAYLSTTDRTTANPVPTGIASASHNPLSTQGRIY